VTERQITMWSADIGRRAGKLGRRPLQAEWRRSLPLDPPRRRSADPAGAGFSEAGKSSARRRHRRHSRTSPQCLVRLPRRPQEVD